MLSHQPKYCINVSFLEIILWYLFSYKPRP